MGQFRDEVDVVIVGGGPAGLSAALCLGRGRKRVVVVDGGSPRHAVAEGVHNYLTREGLPPAELRRLAWEQMAPYTSVSGPVSSRVVRASWDDGWNVEDDAGRAWRARVLLLATGVVDEHPNIPGYQERWGSSLHHCPYCHGWEVQDAPVAVIAAGEPATHLSVLLTGWTSDVQVFTNGVPMEPERRADLASRGIDVHEAPIARLSGARSSLEHIELEDGTKVPRTAAFVFSPQRQVPLVEQLGLTLSEMGYVVVDQQMQTGQPMLWAAGDLTSRMQQVVEAAAQGMRAGATINAILTMG